MGRCGNTDTSVTHEVGHDTTDTYSQDSCSHFWSNFLGSCDTGTSVTCERLSKIDLSFPAKGVALWERQFCDSCAFLSHWARKGASGCATVGGGGSFQTTVAGARAAIAQLSQKSCPPWRQLRVRQRRAGAARLRVEILEKKMRSVAIVASIKKVVEN